MKFTPVPTQFALVPMQLAAIVPDLRLVLAQFLTRFARTFLVALELRGEVHAGLGINASSCRALTCG